MAVPILQMSFYHLGKVKNFSCIIRNVAFLWLGKARDIWRPEPNFFGTPGHKSGECPGKTRTSGVPNYSTPDGRIREALMWISDASERFLPCPEIQWGHYQLRMMHTQTANINYGHVTNALLLQRLAHHLVLVLRQTADCISDDNFFFAIYLLSRLLVLHNRSGQPQLVTGWMPSRLPSADGFIHKHWLNLPHTLKHNLSMF